MLSSKGKDTPGATGGLYASEIGSLGTTSGPGTSTSGPGTSSGGPATAAAGSGGSSGSSGGLLDALKPPADANAAARPISDTVQSGPGGMAASAKNVDEKTPSLMHRVPEDKARAEAAGDTSVKPMGGFHEKTG